MTNFRHGLILSTAFWLIWACAGKPAGSPKIVQPPHPLHYLLVLPMVDMATDLPMQTSLRSPLSGKMYNAGRVDPLADGQMTRELIRQLKGVFPRIRIELTDDKLSIDEANHGLSGNQRTAAAVQRMGQEAGADYVMIGFLYDFRDRSGGDFGVETPAQIAFELNLIRVASGRLVWQSHFKEKQQALNENILQFKKFWRRKGRWVTALQMASAAMEEMIKDLEKKYH